VLRELGYSDTEIDEIACQGSAIRD
jgi:hypothetical protein